MILLKLPNISVRNGDDNIIDKDISIIKQSDNDYPEKLRKIKNPPKELWICGNKEILKKTNNIGNPVAGCNFDLYKDEGCTQKVASGTSGSNGELTFNNLKVGTYFVRETSVPELN